jgi:hypothetical protein
LPSSRSRVCDVDHTSSTLFLWDSAWIVTGRRASPALRHLGCSERPGAYPQGADRRRIPALLEACRRLRMRKNQYAKAQADSLPMKVGSVVYCVSDLFPAIGCFLLSCWINPRFSISPLAQASSGRWTSNDHAYGQNCNRSPKAPAAPPRSYGRSRNRDQHDGRQPPIGREAVGTDSVRYRRPNRPRLGQTLF